MELINLISFIALGYVYGGYLIILKTLSWFMRRKKHSAMKEISKYPFITVLVTVYNEARVIESRIKNILECDYPKNCLEIIVASDGSTDNTDAIVLRFTDARVRLVRPDQRKGKSVTQNQALATAMGEIIVFTDAATRFDRSFLKEVARSFADPQVGGVDGHLLFLPDRESDIAQSQNIYWKQELEIRKLESELGMLAVASGACLAVRASLLRSIPPSVGEDCVIPLDIVSQGYRMVHAQKAIAYDQMDHNSAGEFKSRVRMTLRNWQGTMLYSGLLNPLRYPKIAFALWSHKVLRWLSPIFLLLWLISSFLVSFNSEASSLLGLPGILFVLLGVVGTLAHLTGKKVAVASAIFSFYLANAGFLVGLLKALMGKKVVAYR